MFTEKPSSWRSVRLKDVTTHINRGVAPNYSDEPTEVVVLNQKCIRPDHTIDFALGKFHSNQDSKWRRAQLLPDDIVVNSTGTGTLGRSALFNGYGTSVFADGHVMIVRVDPSQVNARFLAYRLGNHSFYTQANEVMAVGATNQIELNRDRIREYRVSLPDLAEQTRIADYLERELNPTELLIDEQLRQRSLIDRAKREVARNAVTGADVGGDSVMVGPFWLGPTPAVWKPEKVAWRFRTGSGTTPKSTEDRYYSGPYAWLTTGECRDGVVTTTRKTVTDEALNDYTALKFYPRDSLVVAMYGATIGRLAMLGESMTVNQACCVLHQATTVDPWFAFYWFLAHREELMLMGEGGGQPNISQDTVRQLRIPAPDLAEQRAIVQTIRRRHAGYDAIAAEIDQQLQLATEHREALIVAAVTGRIEIGEAA